MTDDPFGTDTEIEPDVTALDSLVNDYLDACEGLEKYETTKKQLAEELARKLGPGGRHEIVPGVGVMVTQPARRFDAKQAASVLTAQQLAAISEFTPSATLAVKVLPGALVDLCKVSNGKPSVRRI